MGTSNICVNGTENLRKFAQIPWNSGWTSRPLLFNPCMDFRRDVAESASCRSVSQVGTIRGTSNSIRCGCNRSELE